MAAKCEQLPSTLGELQFVAAGPINELPGFGYLAWHLVDPSTAVVMSGFDTAVLTPPQQ